MLWHDKLLYPHGFSLGRLHGLSSSGCFFEKKMTRASDEWVDVEAPPPTARYDCGVFTCCFADCFSAQKALSFDQEDMPTLRMRRRWCWKIGLSLVGGGLVGVVLYLYGIWKHLRRLSFKIPAKFFLNTDVQMLEFLGTNINQFSKLPTSSPQEPIPPFQLSYRRYFHLPKRPLKKENY